MGRPPAPTSVDPEPDEIPIAGDDSDASVGRALCRRALAGYPEHVVAAAALLVTELIQNVHRHTASGTGRARVRADAETIRIEVDDDDPTRPLVRYGLPSDRDGWGLRIVDRLATRWGVDGRGAGKTMWVEVHAR